jgi:HEAT repeat protein
MEGEIGDKRALEPLTKALKDKDIRVRMRTTEALDQLGWIPKDDPEKIRYLIARKQ